MTLGHTDETQRNARETTTLSVECRLAEMLAPGREERHCPKRLSWGFFIFQRYRSNPRYDTRNKKYTIS